MKAQNSLSSLIGFFENKKIKMALAGGLALHAYGYTRNTRDVDFVVPQSAQGQILEFMVGFGFETLHFSPGFSNHLKEKTGERIDFVYLDPQTSQKIFQAATTKVKLENHQIPVVTPIHLVAMKAFAVKNDATRKLKEFADIQELIRLKRVSLEQVLEILKKNKLETLGKELLDD